MLSKIWVIFWQHCSHITCPFIMLRPNVIYSFGSSPLLTDVGLNLQHVRLYDTDFQAASLAGEGRGGVSGYHTFSYGIHHSSLLSKSHISNAYDNRWTAAFLHCPAICKQSAQNVATIVYNMYCFKNSIMTGFVVYTNVFS